MTRISSQGLQKRRYEVGSALLVGETLEKLSLYMPDGTPIILGPDPSKMRWRGGWDIAAEYILNDVVKEGTSLYIYLGETAVTGLPTPSTPGSDWDAIADTSAMRFVGTWAPGGYHTNDVVIHDDKLWIAKHNVMDVPFSIVAQAWAKDQAEIDSVLAIPVPAAAQVGDLMIWSGFVTHPARDPKPNDGDWTTLIEKPVAESTDPTLSHGTGVYAKLVEEDDLGSTKQYTGADGNLAIAQMLICRGTHIPIPAEVDFLYQFSHVYGTPLITPPGADPAETTESDKVLRIFTSLSQNFVDTSHPPIWTGGSGGNDRFMTHLLESTQMGSYWANAGATGLPSFENQSGEHHYTIRYTFRLPASSGFFDDDWELLAGSGSGGSALPVGGATGYVLAKGSSADGDVVWAAIPRDLPVGGASGYILAKASATDRDVGWVPAPAGGGGSRRTAAKTTGSLVAAADTGDVTTRLAGGGESGVWTLGVGVLLTKIVVDRACRVRFYTTAAKRDADVSRTRFVDPTGDHGCLSEFLLISPLSLENIPADYLFSGAGDTNIYYRIENYSLSAGSVTATVTVKDVEI